MFLCFLGHALSSCLIANMPPAILTSYALSDPDELIHHLSPLQSKTEKSLEFVVIPEK